MTTPTDYLAKMAQCEMAARFSPDGVADLWRSAADCYLALADANNGPDTANAPAERPAGNMFPAGRDPIPSSRHPDIVPMQWPSGTRRQA